MLRNSLSRVTRALPSEVNAERHLLKVPAQGNASREPISRWECKMRQTRSFMVAAIAACSMLLAASFGAAAHESSSSGQVRQAVAAQVTTARATTSSDGAPNRAPLAIVGIASLGAGAFLLRRAPKLV